MGTNIELPVGRPERKFKGRQMFQGSRKKDDRDHNAILQHFSSNPAALKACKTGDAYGLLPGHDSEQRNGEKAYT